MNSGLMMRANGPIQGMKWFANGNPAVVIRELQPDER
jgi:hypothetical protein